MSIALDTQSALRRVNNRDPTTLPAPHKDLPTTLKELDFRAPQTLKWFCRE
jgi:hypothetical protein